LATAPRVASGRSHRGAAITVRARFGNPIVIDEKEEILAGHLRHDAARELGLKRVPVIQLTHLSKLEKRAFALAENRIALDAGWDRQTLAAELGELTVLLPEAYIDFVTTGFDIAEADIIIGDHEDLSHQPVDEDAAPEPGPAVTCLNDLWVMAGHRLLCGDARDPAWQLGIEGHHRPDQSRADCAAAGADRVG
jgi:hypothetical protein